MSEQETITWIKPNGAEIDTNAEAATINYCIELGWDLKDDAASKEPNGSSIFDGMKMGELDAFAEEAELDVPENWSESVNDQKKMTVAEKKDWLKAWEEAQNSSGE